MNRAQVRAEGFDEKLFVWRNDAQLSCLDFGGYETRNESVARLIEMADDQHELTDFAPVMIHTGDQPINRGDPTWRSFAFSTADGYTDIPIPDFLFDGWEHVGIGDYEVARLLMAQAGSEPAELQRLGWIGNCDTHPSRWKLHALGQAAPELMEIEHVSWVPQEGSDRLAAEAGNARTLAEQVRRWALLIDVEGRGWSARLKLLLHSGRPVLISERPWHEWFWDDLIPMEHFIPVRRDYSDLTERVRWALGHPVESAAIGAQGKEFALRRLTRAAAVERWAEALNAIAADPLPAYGPPQLRAALEPVLRQLGARVP